MIVCVIFNIILAFDDTSKLECLIVGHRWLVDVDDDASLDEAFKVGEGFGLKFSRISQSAKNRLIPHHTLMEIFDTRNETA